MGELIKIAQRIVDTFLGTTWGCLKLLFAWNKPDDQEWSEFIAEKAGALALLLLIIAALAFAIFWLLAKTGW